MIRFSIRRPIAVAMLYTAVAVMGVVSWLYVPVELLPDTQLPRLRIAVQWPGASPEVTEALLTSPVEAAVQQVRGVERIQSESREGSGSIDVEFARGTDMNFARLELSERLAALDDELPRGARRPQVQPYVPEEFRDQRRPFLSYTLTGPYTPEALRRHVDDELAPALRQVEGVADVQAVGGRARMLEIQLEPTRILALGLTPELVRQRVRELEDVREAGAVESDGLLYTVALRERAETADDVRQAPLLSGGGRVVRLRDVATVHDTYEDVRDHYRIDGQTAVSFNVVKEIGTNVVDVADRVKEGLTGLEPELPTGARLILDNDESAAVRAQLSDLSGRAATAAVIVFFVLYLFLRSFRSTAIVFASIAFAVLITLNLVYFGGMTLNMLSLMGLAMGFGLVIDNAVVVLENVHRHTRTAGSAEAAAERGARGMVLPVLAATFTTLVVFIPFVYLQGELRLFYIPLVVVVGFTNLASLFVSFSFTPALAGRFLRGEVRRAAAAPVRERPPLYVRMYGALVHGTLRFPWVALVLPLLVLGGSWHLFDKNVNRGTVWRPWWEQQSYIQITVDMPRGEEIERTDELTRHFEARLAELPEVDRFVTRVYPQSSRITVTFPDSIEATSIPLATKERLEAYSHLFGGTSVRVYGYGPSFYGGGSSPPNYSIKVLGYNYEHVREIAEDLGRRLKGFSRIQEVDTNAYGAWYQRDRATEVVLRVDRARLGMYGLTSQELVGRVTSAVRGAESLQDNVRLGDEELRFSVRLAGHERMDVDRLRELAIPASGGETVRLANVADVEEREVLGRIVRENQQYQRLVSYEFRGPNKLGDRVHAAVMENTRLPAGYTLVGREEWRWSDDERTQIYWVLAFSLVLIFMVTAALFESIRQPLCVLLTVPMALIGVFLVFYFTGASFTREAFIGVIMMGGVVTNNATLLVDHINQLRRRYGIAFRDAIHRGTMERVRPILMTSIGTILGLLPLVLFSETADSNIWNALGFSLLGGLASSTILVMTVTPALYLLFERGPEKRRQRREAAEGGPEPAPA
jgi:hydrophobic/amphiphilic exporter-1 (mainly G- bacteria), HAE1 family